jgi:hypothetical protein
VGPTTPNLTSLAPDFDGLSIWGDNDELVSLVSGWRWITGKVTNRS